MNINTRFTQTFLIITFIFAPLASASTDSKAISTDLVLARDIWVKEQLDAHPPEGDPHSLADWNPLETSPSLAPQTSSQRKVFPEINTVDNPIFQAAMKNAKKVIPKLINEGKRDTFKASIEDGWQLNKYVKEAIELSWALCHPQSELYQNPDLLYIILDRYHSALKQLDLGKYRSNFGATPNIATLHLLLTSTFVDLLPSASVKRYEKHLREISEEMLIKKQKLVSQPDSWPLINAEARWVVFFHISFHLFQDQRYKEMGEKLLEVIAKSVLPDGGFHYVEQQNEVFAYHSGIIRSLAWVAQLSDSNRAEEIIAATRWYYPLSVEPRGVAEYSTATSWKPYWNNSNGSNGALIVSSVTGCRHNQRISSNISGGGFWLSSFYDSKMNPLPAPDSYITYDKNIQGPRGRFGDFSFSATSREVETLRGKSTYVGCMALYPKDQPLPKGALESWPLSAALHSVRSEVRFKKGYEIMGRNHTAFSVSEKNSTIVLDNVATLSTTHHISKIKENAQPWRGLQSWIMTPHRIVGILHLESEEKQKAFSMGGRIKMVGDRGKSGIKKQWVKVSDREYKFDHLNIIIHETSYPMINTIYGGTIFKNDGKSGELILTDGADDSLRQFNKGDRHYFMVEVFPSWSKPALKLEQHTSEGQLYGISLKDTDGSKYTLVHNPTEVTQQWKHSTNRIKVYGPDQRHRPKWLSPTTSAQSKAKIYASSEAIEIEPYSSVLLED